MLPSANITRWYFHESIKLPTYLPVLNATKALVFPLGNIGDSRGRQGLFVRVPVPDISGILPPINLPLFHGVDLANRNDRILSSSASYF